MNPVQLNIFLAILVDGFMALKHMSGGKQSVGMHIELYGVLKHDCQRVLKWFVPSYPFISDDDLVSRISAKLRSTRSASILNIHRVLGDFHGMSLQSSLEISLRSGERLKSETIHNLFGDLHVLHNHAGHGLETDQYLQTALKDLMLRFSSPEVPDPFRIRQEQNKAFMEAAKLETMKRVAQMHLSSLGASIKIEDERLESEGMESNPPRTLNVTIERARHLPQMDLRKGVDVFCAVFVEGAPGLFQTRILRGKSEADWTWGADASFDWNLGPTVHADELDRKIVIMVYDKDQISSDDLIGCVTLKAGELHTGPLDEWREIIRPPMLFYERKRGPEKAELKLKASIRSEHASPVISPSQTSGLPKAGVGHHLELEASSRPLPSARIMPHSSLTGNGSGYASSSTLVLGPPSAGAAAYQGPTGLRALPMLSTRAEHQV